MNGISKCSSSEYSEDDPFGRMLSFVTAGVEERDPQAGLVAGIQSKARKGLLEQTSVKRDLLYGQKRPVICGLLRTCPLVFGAAFLTNIC
jgi:hypothetical protein